MKNVLHKKIWNRGAVQMHVEPLMIPFIESKNYRKSYKYCVEIKLRWDPTLENSNTCDLKMALFDNGNLEELLLFARNFQMNLETSVMIAASTKIQYLCTLLHGEALCKLYKLYVEVVSKNAEH